VVPPLDVPPPVDSSVLIDCVTDAIVIVGADLTVRYVNAAGRKQLSLGESVFGQVHAADLIAPSDLARVAEQFTDLLSRPGGQMVIELDIVRGDFRLPVEATATNLVGRPGVDGVVVCFRNLARERRSDERAARLMAALEASSDLVIVHGADGTVLEENSAARRFVGGRTHLDELYGPDECAWLKSEVLGKKHGHSVLTRDATLIGSNGALVDASLVVTMQRGSDGTVESFAVTARDLTQRKQIESALAHRASHDLLTGLLNRVGVVAELDRLQAQGPTDDTMLLFIDLDDFKQVNDTYGHQIGDDVLAVVAERLRGAVRAGDVLARWSGDEFVAVLAPPTDSDVGEQSARRIGELLAAPIVVGQHAIHLTVSIGIASGSVVAAGHELLRQADVAMYDAKRRGKNRIGVFTPVMQDRIAAEQHQLTEIRRGFAAREFVSTYEPVFLIADDTPRLCGFESSISWQHPTRGLLAYRDFIGDAERAGLLAELDDLMLQDTCARLAEWHAVAPDIYASVNLGPQSIDRPDLVAWIENSLGSVSAKHLVIELADGMLTQIDHMRVAAIAEVGSLGVRIAVDAIGSGSTSLSNLALVDLDVGKIDAEFVRLASGGANPFGLIAHAVVAACSAISVEVVCEHIGTEQQLSEARSLGIRFGQGALFSAPLSAADATTLVHSTFG
jgi:diguanylate cyclase (GGDEF)-like protein/PAS domain S-box-containing protein